MKRLLIITFFVLFFAPIWGAENDTSTLRFLRFQGGVGYGLYRDLGASPLTFRGVEIFSGVTYSVERPKWHLQASLMAEGGAYGLRPGFSYVQAYGGVGTLRFVALYIIYAHDGWQVWGGGSLSENFDMRYNASLGNASTGITNYIMPTLAARAAWRHGLTTLHGQIDFAPASLMLRPGFAYMDNFDRDIARPVANTFGQYSWYVAGAVGMATEIGITWDLSHGNRVGLGYQWHYVTSRTHGLAAPHCFQQVSHSFVTELSVAL